jgi:hypothetical protein
MIWKNYSCIRQQLIIPAVTIGTLFFTLNPVNAEKPGPALAIDFSADRHPINPDIYGMAYPDPALAKEIQLPLNRWGGDATTRYNWKIDSTNAGDDWFFMAGGSNPHPTSSAGPDALVTQSKSDGGRALLTIPIIDFINSSVANDSSFPVSLFGNQQKVNPYVHPIVNGKQTDSGNGRTPDGKPIPLTKEQILRIHTPNSPDFQRGWIEHLVKQFGTTAQSGVGMYELDNEPGGWNNTHRDVHPGLTGHDELISRSIAYAAMIKSVDPTALVVGPGDFVMHYQNTGKPGDGDKEHNGLGQGNYYLQQMHDYETKHGQRILDYFDEHYYPLDQDGQTPDTILECTRSLWDPSYKEKNWVGQYMGPKNLIPKFHQWVNQYYPGTKISISEYGWGDNKTLLGALAEADVLGIFGREQLDMACMFGPPKATESAANSFRIFLNYDGHGSRFGDVWVKSTSEDQSRLSIYGSERTADHALTFLIINKSHDDLSSKISLAHFNPPASAKVFRYSSANLSGLVPQPDQPLSSTGFSITFPAQSVTLFIVPGR